MQTFHINAEAPGGGLRYQHTKVDTSIANGAASATVTVDRGITNPIYILSTGMLGRPDVASKQRTTVVEHSAALDDAVTALHALGDQHGITGINLSTDPAQTGSVMFADQPGLFQSGGPTTARVGTDALRAIDDAARAVLGIATS